MKALPRSKAAIPSIAVGSSAQSIATDDSSRARAHPAKEPSIVPRIVWGRVNLTNAWAMLESPVGPGEGLSAPVTILGA